MLGKLFQRILTRKATSVPAPAPTPAPISVATPATPTPRPAIDMNAQIQAARGDDAALLCLLREVPQHALRLALLQELEGEAALHEAERMFRSRDKTLHRLARQRLEQRKKTQTAHSAAQHLIDDARALLQEAERSPLPANRLVELDHAWATLDATLLTEATQQAFHQQRTALQQRMQAQTEQRREQQRQEQRQKDEEHSAQAAEIAAQERIMREEAAARQQHYQAAQQAQAQAAAQQRAVHQTWQQQLDTLETTLAQGHVQEAAAQLASLREHLAQSSLPQEKSDELKNRLQHLQGEFARLKEWQRWGDHQAWETLMAEAEQLAQQAASLPATALPLHGRSIGKLRARWKSLAASGSTAPHALWQRFDRALQAAWQPISAQQQQRDEKRQQNLQQRRALLAQLDSQPLPDEAAPTESAATATAAAVSWHEVAQTLQQFHAAWRKLGPPEHTLPAAELPALKQHLDNALARLEQPLQQARQAEHQRRCVLIERAQQLLHLQDRGTTTTARTLQAEWQQRARLHLLPHKEEQALWRTFQQAIDELFAQRQAARQSQHAEQQAQQAQRGTLIDELRTLLSAAAPSCPDHELTHHIDTLERRWAACLPHAHHAHHASPGQRTHPLDTEWRKLCQQARQHLSHLRRQRWQREFDTLYAWLQRSREDQDQDHAPWPFTCTGSNTAPPILPPLWLAAAQPQSANTPPADDHTLAHLLLQLEASLDLPTPAEHLEARRQLKLHAMKQRLERHTPAGDTNPDPLRLVARLIPHLPTADQSPSGARLQAILQQLRNQPPASLFPF